MAGVAFQLAFKSPELNSLDLPIDIRKPNFALVDRVLSTETIDLAAGRYYALASMPAGQRLIASFEVKEPSQTQVRVTLAPDPEDESPHEWEEVQHFLGRRSHRVSADPATDEIVREMRPDGSREGLGFAGAGSGPRRAPLLRLFMGNVVRGTHTPLPPLNVLQVAETDTNRVLRFVVPAGMDLLIAQLVQPEGRVQNLTLPRSPIAGVHLVISRDEAGEPRLDAYLANSDANLLLQYTGAGWSTSAARATSATAKNAERLVHDKIDDPIGAAVGAYCILRLGSIEQLHDWTSNLRWSFPWMPDGSAVCGEHLARLGRFEEAFDAFAEVPRRGLPLFADGLFYTIERMKLYANERVKSPGRIDRRLAQAVVEQLQPFAGLVRRQRPICTYPGLDAGHPNSDPAPADVTANSMLDLRQWFPPDS
jgi:hypothetical protein